MLEVYCILHKLDGSQVLRKTKQYKTWWSFYHYYVEKHPYQVVYVCNRFGVWYRVTGWQQTVHLPDCFLPCKLEESK